MKMYVYKMQWLLEPKQAYKAIKLFGARSFTYLSILNSELKRIDQYSGFISFPYGLAEIETIKYLKRQFKNNKEARYIELYRTN